jgi:hypothetical protein
MIGELFYIHNHSSIARQPWRAMIRDFQDDVHRPCSRWHHTSARNNERSVSLIEVLDLNGLPTGSAGCGERADFRIVKPVVRECISIRIRRALGAKSNAITFGCLEFV